MCDGLEEGERITEGTRNRGKQGYKVRRKGQDGAGTGLQ